LEWKWLIQSRARKVLNYTEHNKESWVQNCNERRQNTNEKSKIEWRKTRRTYEPQYNSDLYITRKKQPKRKRPLERTRCRWEDNIKMNFEEIRLKGVDWIPLACYRDQLRTFVNTVMNHKMRGISWLAERTISFSRRTLLHGVS
jgi:hypothetical protein